MGSLGKMVNAHERGVASRLVYGLLTGHVSPLTFEAEYPVHSADNGVRAIYRQLWLQLEEGSEDPLRVNELAVPGL